MDRELKEVKTKSVEHETRIAVLEQIAKDSTEHNRKVEDKLDKMYDAYMLQQGSFASLVDMKDIVKALDERIDKLENKIAYYMGAAAVIGALLGALIPHFISKL